MSLLITPLIKPFSKFKFKCIFFWTKTNIFLIVCFTTSSLQRPKMRFPQLTFRGRALALQHLKFHAKNRQGQIIYLSFHWGKWHWNINNFTINHRIKNINLDKKRWEILTAKVHHWIWDHHKCYVFRNDLKSYHSS